MDLAPHAIGVSSAEKVHTPHTAGRGLPGCLGSLLFPIKGVSRPEMLVQISHYCNRYRTSQPITDHECHACHYLRSILRFAVDERDIGF